MFFLILGRTVINPKLISAHPEIYIAAKAKLKC